MHLHSLPNAIGKSAAVVPLTRYSDQGKGTSSISRDCPYFQSASRAILSRLKVNMACPNTTHDYISLKEN